MTTGDNRELLSEVERLRGQVAELRKGIRPEVAQSLVALQADISGVVTQRDLQSGIAFAMQARTRRVAPGVTADRPSQQARAGAGRRVTAARVLSRGTGLRVQSSACA